MSLNYSEHIFVSRDVYKKLLHQYKVSLVMKKPAFCIFENKDADQLRGYLISAFVFATWIVQPLFYLDSKFQASSHLLFVYSLVCVRAKPPKTCFLTTRLKQFKAR